MLKEFRYEAIKNAVVSHKALIESDIEAQRAEIMSKLEKGQVLEGTVKNITDFGAFMDLGGLDGLFQVGRHAHQLADRADDPTQLPSLRGL